MAEDSTVAGKMTNNSGYDFFVLYDLLGIIKQKETMSPDNVHEQGRLCSAVPSHSLNQLPLRRRARSKTNAALVQRQTDIEHRKDCNTTMEHPCSWR
jgi:hypothetical protein